MSDERNAGKPAMPAGGGMRMGCLFCRSGSEGRLLSEMALAHGDIELLSPQKVRLRRMGGRRIEERTTLFPGYLFFRTRGEPDFREWTRRKHLYRLLTYPDGDWILHGADRAVAEWLFDRRGIVGLSRACHEGDGLRFVDGMLEGREPEIVKLNRRACTAQVKLDLMGIPLTLWLGYELIDPVTLE